MITASGRRFRRRRHLSEDALQRILRYRWTTDWRPEASLPFTTEKPNGQQHTPVSPAARV